MAATPRRALLLFPLLLLAIFVAGPATGNLRAPSSALAAGNETFTNPAPLKLYATDASHPGVIDADPADGTNGYCIAIENEGNFAVPDALAADPPVVDGFSVIDGVLIDTAFFDNGTSTAIDDVYCAIIASGPSVTAMTLRWEFTDGETGGLVELPLQVVEVTLQGSDGFVGSPATVCTVGWDPQFLTGAASNAAPGSPDPVDEVVAADWSPTAGSVLGDPFKVGGEWCVNITSGSEELDVDVSLLFDAVYNRGTDDDDSSQVASLDSPDGLVNIFAEPDYSELRHVGPSGQTYDTQVSQSLAVRGQHTACIVPSGPNDELKSDDVFFSGVGASSVNIFHDGDGIDLPGVVDGTLCLSWTASTPGDQFLTVQIEKVDGSFPGTRNVGWDSNDDGNDDDDETDGPSNHALVMDWRAFERTEITRSANFDPTDTITNSTITEQLRLNVADGTYTFAGGPVLPLYEWVLAEGDVPLTGVELEARITSTCGNFLNEDDAEDVLGKTIRGRSNDGRFDRIDLGASPPEPYGDGPDDLLVTILNDGGCFPSSTIDIEIDASLAGGEVIETETLTIQFIASTAGQLQTPTVAWAGQVVDVTFGIAAAGGECVEGGSGVHFSIEANNVGAFLTHPTLESIGAGHLFGPLGDECTQTVRFQSSTVGEVTVHVSLEGNPYARASFPIYFMAIEDVSFSATPQLYVSEIGEVEAVVRGWFPGANSSGREARITEDGRGLPADRWVLPDDWDQLRGDPDFVTSWPDSPLMPTTQVTFFMEREGVANDYPEGPSNGALGWFLVDGTETSWNVNPRTGASSILGSEDRPRILTEWTDQDGIARLRTFGDLNVAYTDCPVNGPTGNPHCDVDDFVGLTDYYAIADLPGIPGHHAPVRSTNDATEWLWAGYKRVTIVDTAAPTVKYVVAHLRDRDGYCDALSYNNVLGIEIDFVVDGGEGRIIEAVGDPSFMSGERTRAWATTFDLLDNQGNPTHTDIAVAGFSEDECQAWIRVSNSTKSATNVFVNFPGSPAPIPGDIRITGLVCTGDELVTVTNQGDNPVSLAGFGLQSPQSDPFAPLQHLQLDGLLEPGESATFAGGPNAGEHGWLNASGEVFFESETVADWANLTWDGFELSRAYCDGTFSNPDLPESLPSSGEGPITIDVIVPFDDEISLALVPGWNLVTVPGEGFLEALMSGNGDAIDSVYGWNELDRRWEHLFPSAPAFVSNLHTMEPGRSYWIEVNRPFTVIYYP